MGRRQKGWARTWCALCWAPRGVVCSHVVLGARVVARACVRRARGHATWCATNQMDQNGPDELRQHMADVLPAVGDVAPHDGRPHAEEPRDKHPFEPADVERLADLHHEHGGGRDACGAEHVPPRANCHTAGREQSTRDRPDGRQNVVEVTRGAEGRGQGRGQGRRWRVFAGGCLEVLEEERAVWAALTVGCERGGRADQPEDDVEDEPTVSVPMQPVGGWAAAGMG